eukprot:139833-Pelagomonas_calceolata.AAC.1
MRAPPADNQGCQGCPTGGWASCRSWCRDASTGGGRVVEREEQSSRDGSSRLRAGRARCMVLGCAVVSVHVGLARWAGGGADGGGPAAVPQAYGTSGRWGLGGVGCGDGGCPVA